MVILFCFAEKKFFKNFFYIFLLLFLLAAMGHHTPVYCSEIFKKISPELILSNKSPLPQELNLIQTVSCKRKVLLDISKSSYLIAKESK